ncbi:TetR family transcriptional regulator C-terminal domain-containing protein [Paenarthrobacter sp. PH39-S1]|uniref:TetR/AcrR family transcriptional regulator n=1 Tax=Paenarthrobacter sp. PH39-S1 TaxID=3046204 RepID=UPI0024B8BCCD|nr:TetR family transcriptional regulator C-terminal domain-containing protein [Paenarthrobacter sp. PH39-S1]MDJ0355640.1 TetR family transcriptional regulator C-terminal domain-containing protein [Paenarthrobacter sp. PH39-S1]
MPKVIDPLIRREDVVQALFQVVAESGLEAASLRAVAAEAGLAVGSVRHYFDGQAELMIFAFRTVSARIRGRLEDRVAALESASGTRRAPGDRLSDACAEVLLELLPLDAQRELESSVWLSFVTAARTDVVLAAEADSSYRGTAGLVGRIIMVLLASPATRTALEPVVEAERLLALIDGLCLHMLLQPGWTTEELSRNVLRAHLSSLRGA